ncbi:hypothetical protein HN51_032101 [Arachis hypogaea]|uniref:Uncharacterized protein n=1 Tax=Arachis hypogaea TaxID=3818 RepID=A0A445B5S7_ARAHY|nr:uncharacterized protein DS421_10g303060 [Arachis hypogaea]QHO16383.1 uncharacterized protein DS421_10g303060 [Arachis hypogaea]RYR34029.1 hypothetical protein Ahy_A10g048741 [Arachis hypogaea]
MGMRKGLLLFNKKHKIEAIVVILAIVMCIMMCQGTTEATSRLRSMKKEGFNVKASLLSSRLHKTMEMEDYGTPSSYESPPADDYDYDFYRKHGDIPSPGAGH